MDFEDRIINWMGEVYTFLTEDYLISLANKGIYNRGKKDLEKCKDQLKPILIDDENLQIDFEDGTKIILKKDIQSSECSCIAQNICRHLMTAFLYCKLVYEQASANEKQNTDKALNIKEVNKNTDTNIEKTQKAAVNVSKENNDYKDTKILALPELEQLTQSQVVKYFGKRLYNQGIKKYPTMKDITFTYGPLVTVRLENNVTVYFTQNNTLEQAVCSCKEKGPCIHKLCALLAYLEKVGKNICIAEEVDVKFGEAEENCLRQIKLEIANIVDKGLSGITEGTLKKVEMLYIKAYNYKYYELANDLKRLSGELIYYFSRNVNFSSRGTMHLLSRIYNRIEALLNNRDDKQKLAILAGKLREEGISYDTAHLWGLGARCYLSKRKDLLITAYFYCKETANVLTMTTLRPMEQSHLGDMRYKTALLNRAINYLYTAPVIWEEEYPFERVMRSEIIVSEASIKEGKISTTKKSTGKIIKQTDIDEIAEFAKEDYSIIKEEIQNQENTYFEPVDFNKGLYIIKATESSEMSFDKIKQRLEFIVYDIKGNEILFYVPYNMINEDWIKELENRKHMPGKYFLGNVKLKNNQLEAQLLNTIDLVKEKKW